MQRKPGGYRAPTETQRDQSRLSREEFDSWFQQFWNITGASTREHPAPFPVELPIGSCGCSRSPATRSGSVRGTGTTMLAAMRCGRNSIGVEIEPEIRDDGGRRLRMESGDLFDSGGIEFLRLRVRKVEPPGRARDRALYATARRARRRSDRATRICSSPAPQPIASYSQDRFSSWTSVCRSASFHPWTSAGGRGAVERDRERVLSVENGRRRRARVVDQREPCFQNGFGRTGIGVIAVQRGNAAFETYFGSRLLPAPPRDPRHRVREPTAGLEREDRGRMTWKRL